MNIKPKAQIGEVVNIVGCDCVTTSYGWSTKHLWARNTKKQLQDYYVHDVKVEISLKSGDIKYNYLISTSKEINEKFFYGGWVSDRSIELVQENVVAV